MSTYFSCVSNKPAMSYQCGETMTIQIIPKKNCQEIECQRIKWSLQGDDGKSSEGFGSAEPGKPLILETTIDRPGFVKINCVAVDEEGNEIADFDPLIGSVGAEVEKLSYHDTLPEDFQEYWADIETLIANCDCKLLSQVELTEGVKEDYYVYDVRIETPCGRPASGTITIPKAEGKYPIRVTYMGYGVHITQPLYTPNYITAFFNAHGIENTMPVEELREKYKDLMCGEDGLTYGFHEDLNADKMRTYYRDMMIRNLAAVKYMKTLPQWDGKGLEVAGGSQGGYQAIVVAAHDKDVTFVDVYIPWFCDINGSNHGYIKSLWVPKFQDGLRYFDCVAHGMQLKCPIKILAYSGDFTCPPSTVMALYNSIKAPKHLEMVQGGTHGYRPPERIGYHLVEGNELKIGKYRHYKGGEYTVLDVGYHSETEEEMVIYKSIANGNIWVRPKWMFCEHISVKGVPEKRFTYIG